MQTRRIADKLGKPPKYETFVKDGSEWVRNPITGTSERIGSTPTTKTEYNQALHRLAAKDGNA